MEASKEIRLKKAGEEEVYGPMDMDELIILANNAYISPEDQISIDKGEWTKATDIERLAMVWTIHSDGGMEYGPTTVGTVKEFLVAGEIKGNDSVTHTKTNETRTVESLLGADQVAAAAEERHKISESAPDQGLEESLEIAKDLRIRRLESDLERLKRKHEELTQKYRQVSEQLLRDHK
jgi:hypothetical protein